VPLDDASVLAHRAEGEPEVHGTGAADDFVMHLAAQPDALSDEFALMMLASVGALAMVTRVEAEEVGQYALIIRRHLICPELSGQRICG
jgi:hypothetical protein